MVLMLLLLRNVYLNISNICCKTRYLVSKKTGVECIYMICARFTCIIVNFIEIFQEWELLGFSARRGEKFYSCCKDPYLDVTYTLKIRRRTMYYFSNLILPCVLIGKHSHRVIINANYLTKYSIYNIILT